MKERKQQLSGNEINSSKERRYIDKWGEGETKWCYGGGMVGQA